jgi:tubulin beta
MCPIDPTSIHQGDYDILFEIINAFYNEATGGKYFWRAIFIDLEPGTIKSICAGPFGLLFRTENFFFGQTGVPQETDCDLSF